MILWLTGQPGSGKTTLAKAFIERVTNDNPDIKIININLDNSIVILDLNLSLVSDSSINLYLNSSIENDGVMKKIICGPKLKSHLQNKYFKITSRFVDASSSGISTSGIINDDTSILLRFSGNTIDLMGLTYNDQP